MVQLRLSPYGYTPTEYVCLIFVALFALSTGQLLDASFLINLRAILFYFSYPPRPVSPLSYVVAATLHWFGGCSRGTWLGGAALVVYFSTGTSSLRNSVRIFPQLYSLRSSWIFLSTESL